MCKYVVKYRVIGECLIEVDADDKFEAIKKADNKMCEKDFCDLNEVEDFNPVYIEEAVSNKKVAEF